MPDTPSAPARPSIGDPRRRRALPLVVLGATSLALAGALAAHDTWLMPVAGRVPVGGRASLDMTSAGRFPVAETAIRPDRIERAEARLGGTSTPLVTGSGSAKALRLVSAPLATAGTATLFVTLRPRTLALKPDQVAHYLDEVGADSSVRAAYARSGGAWTETYVKHAKSHVRVGDAVDSSWREPVGQRLELVPQRDPVRLRAGGVLAVQVLRCMVPQPGQAVGWVRAGSRRSGMATADAEGVVRITLDRPGRWLVRATAIRPREQAMSAGGCEQATDPAAPDAAWRSDFATLVLEVR
jgi:hypothetical protein